MPRTEYKRCSVLTENIKLRKNTTQEDVNCGKRWNNMLWLTFANPKVKLGQLVKLGKLRLIYGWSRLFWYKYLLKVRLCIARQVLELPESAIFWIQVYYFLDICCSYRREGRSQGGIKFPILCHPEICTIFCPKLRYSWFYILTKSIIYRIILFL